MCWLGCEFPVWIFIYPSWLLEGPCLFSGSEIVTVDGPASGAAVFSLFCSLFSGYN
jgi:hypothetical protein